MKPLLMLVSMGEALFTSVKGKGRYKKAKHLPFCGLHLTKICMCKRKILQNYWALVDVLVCVCFVQ